jgi:hypothetical protein
VQKYAREMGKEDKEGDDDAGHILANRLGGYAVPVNIFPQDPHMNRGAYRSFEGEIYNCMSKNTKANLAWKFQYPSSTSTRPSGEVYTVTFTDSECTDMKSSFDNSN